MIEFKPPADDPTVEIKDHIGVFHHALTKEECEQIIDFFEDQLQNKPEHSGIFDRSNQAPNNVIDDISWSEVQEARSNNSLTLNNYGIWDPIYNRIMDCFREYVKKYNIINNYQKIRLISGLKIQKTEPCQGYHLWHFESASYDTMTRIAAFTIYLNDVDVGGETEFLYQSARLKPTQGTLTVFPAGYTHPHRGNPPLSNTKYIMTGWYECVE